MKASPPPLHLLTTFEVAARLLSFRKAANELHVTPPAVSQQIKQLEEHLEESLFLRESGRVSLTTLGEQFYLLVDDLLSGYQSGYRTLHQSHAAPVMRISTLSQIAADVLIPALPQFQQAHPDIDLRLETCEEIVELDPKWISGAIRVGRGEWPNLKSMKLCNLTASIVGSPEMLKNLDLSSINSIQDLTLIHSRTHVNDWQRVSELTGFDFSKNKQLFFNNLSSALIAAENGVGVAIAMFPLASNLVRQGRLAQLAPHQIPVEEACYFTYLPSLETDAHFSALKGWLESVFQRDRKSVV